MGLSTMSQLFAVLLLVGIVAHFIWWIIGMAAIVLMAWTLKRAYRDMCAARDARRRQVAELAARADRQHAWVMAGDDRGIYGDYPPARLNREPTTWRYVVP
ncbi:hypothetical protein [Mycobacterium heckeshornense]|uniref:hypothetical protein n=1 Tax=Mycobacterium heckeshornense TaxID=110505 RepID=UPI001940CE9C|nr:hypothetical protein [Mycobacterium heckeshornense]